MKTKALFIIVLSSLIIFGSCTKSKEAKLEGKWRKIEVTDIGVPKPIEIWEFKSGELTISRIPLPIGNTAMVEESRAKYTLGFNGSNYTLNITKKVSGKDLNWVQADGKIQQLDNDYLKWFNKNGFYGEFVRYE